MENACKWEYGRVCLEYGLSRSDIVWRFLQADAESVSKRFQCWRKAVERSYDLEDFELQ